MIKTNTHLRPYTLYILTGCLALNSTAASAIFPVFAKKLSLFGSGVEFFGLSATAFSLTALFATPYAGSIADRIGRRKVLLSALIAQAVVNLGYLLAPTGGIFIGTRALAGVLTAGLVPATISMVGDIASRDERGRWIGFVNGWSAIGFVVGPPLGGWLYELLGLTVPFIVAATLNILAFLTAFFMIPETVNNTAQDLNNPAKESKEKKPSGRLWEAFPRPYGSFILLLVISFIAVFAWRFVEPQFHFFIYDELGWTSSRFGLTMSGYAILLMFAETFLGRLCDHFGRKPILMIGLIIHCAQYIALVTTDLFLPIALGIAFSGLGEGLFMPALNAYYLDITPEKHRARVIGIKESAFTLGGLTGPALVVLLVQYLGPREIFIIAGALIFFSGLLVSFLYRKKHDLQMQFVKVV